MLFVHILDCNMEMIQQFNQLLHLCALESLVTGNPDETYNKSPQPWGELDQVVKSDEVSCTDVDQDLCRPGEIPLRGPSLEKVCDRLGLLTLENYVNQPPVVVGVSESDFAVLLPHIEVTKAKFQTDKEKALPVLKFFAVPVYRRAPFICKLCQTHGSDFQLGQVA